MNLLSSDTDTKMMPLIANSLADQVADSIVDAIARQKFVPGQRLVEMDVAAALGVSRVPVREAMRILASQGIIAQSHRRGMYVTAFDALWAEQLHNARVAIERLAVRIVAEKLRDDPAITDLLRKRVLVIEEEAARARHEWFAINRADIAFHATVFEIAASPLLSTLWAAISRHVLIMFAMETYRDRQFERIVEEHRNYIEMLLSGSEAEMDAEIQRHVAGARIFSGELDGLQAD